MAKRKANQADKELAATQKWSLIHQHEDWRDFETNDIPALPWVRITFDVEDHTAYATPGNPDATIDGGEELAIDGEVTLAWDEAKQIVGVSGDNELEWEFHHGQP